MRLEEWRSTCRARHPSSMTGPRRRHVPTTFHRRSRIVRTIAARRIQEMVPLSRDRWPDCRRTASDVHRDRHLVPLDRQGVNRHQEAPACHRRARRRQQRHHPPPRPDAHRRDQQGNQQKWSPLVQDQRPTLRPRRRPPAGRSSHRPLCRPRQRRAGPRAASDIAAAVGGRRGTLPGSLNRRKRLALRSPKPSSRSGHALLLHADQVSGGYNSPTSMVSRRPLAPGGPSSPFSPTPQAAIAPIAAPPLTIRVRVTGGSSSEPGTGSCCTRSASSFADRFESDRCFTFAISDPSQGISIPRHNLGPISPKPRGPHRTSSPRRTDSPSARSCAEEESWQVERHARVAVVASVLVSGPLVRSAETMAEVPFELYQHHLVVTKGSIGPLNGRNLLIDTGTIPSVVDGRIARKLRLKTEPSTLIAFGQQVPIESAVFEGFRIGSLQSGPVPAVVGDLSYLKGAPIDAIVGLDVLARTNFSIDYQTRMLEFRAREGRGRGRAAGDRVAVCDGEDDHRRPAGSIAGRHRQQRSGAVQDADARRPLRCALERRQDRAVCVRRGAPAAARAAPGRPRSARVGQTASLGARPSAQRIPAEHRRRASGCWPSAASACDSTSRRGEFGWSR